MPFGATSTGPLDVATNTLSTLCAVIALPVIVIGVPITAACAGCASRAPSP